LRSSYSFSSSRSAVCHTTESIYRHTPGQCRINANRGPWQLFTRAPLFTRDKRPITASHSSRYDMLAIISSRYQHGPFFIFVVAEVMSNYLTTDGLKKILYFRKPPFGQRPVAFATSATWLIRHCSRHGIAGPLAARGGGQICRPFVLGFGNWRACLKYKSHVMSTVTL